MDGTNDDDAADGSADALAELDEPGSMTISRKAGAALRARAAEYAAAEGGEDTANDAATDASFNEEYRKLYEK